MHSRGFFVCDARVVAAETLIERLTASDRDFHDHCYATGILAAQILSALGKSERVCATGFIVGLLHDAGLLRAAEPPKDALPRQWQLFESRMRRATYAALREVPALAPFAALAANVHMQRGPALVTKAVMVADQYDVLTRRWGANPAHCSDADALRALQRAAGRRYDVRVVGALQRVWANLAA